ncbi:nitric oxide synthase [Collybia nuda]|uniref:nitric-oxide synthase (NADPH) n=1 Tax=Collybia nuda TaxID=64659 RepID=A0A9P6CE66_9AGAR|nr:nitric oxide synthase [Collybia nuda]
MAHKCPAIASNYNLIKENHGNLASTGCTRDFCQSGRLLHTDEPRVGENRAIEVVEKEAEDFIKQLHNEKFFASEEAFQDRLRRALYEIRSTSAEGVIRETGKTGVVGGVWMQTPEELEFGLQRAWRNARKCIMRSHCEDLRLCDLRGIKSSELMAVELLKAVNVAYNGGNIVPTVFVFPPRTANNRGPMVWNDQILTFAAYENEDGTIQGDPKNIQLTKDLIEFGWVPPVPAARTRWDVLPLVVMAEGDKPVLIDIPANLRRLVKIRHPKYEAAFWKLDLKWVAFPALSRLGFDIGGVQYTATPFIGWFMDAEIGVRNLADSFRYNVLPDVVKELRLDEGALAEVDAFEDLPEYQQLAMLNRAQIELNYAVHASFLRDRISMSDSLTASLKWTKYDDEFEKKNGYRLPADPYWVAPPQGSIIPLWHRGGAPNYQPKPMIARHVQEPAKAWKREKDAWHAAIVPRPIPPKPKTAPQPVPQPKSETKPNSLSSSWENLGNVTANHPRSPSIISERGRRLGGTRSGSVIRKELSRRSSANFSVRGEPDRQAELPADIRMAWSTVYIPTLRAYAGTLRGPNPFVVEDPVTLISTVFKHVYPNSFNALKSEIAPKHTIYELSMANLNAWHSGFRTASSKAVEALFANKDEYPTQEDIATYVASIIHASNPIFFWREYSETRKSGKYEDPLVLETFGNAHLKSIASVNQDWFPSKTPYAALALTLASLERAYFVWNQGYFDKDLSQTIAFSDDFYGREATSYMKATLLLPENKWQAIHRGASQIVGSLNGFVKIGHGDDEEFDPRAVVEDSDGDD